MKDNVRKNLKIVILTTLICLLPVVVGAAVYTRLPERMVTHWGFNGEPDGWSSRAFTVFGLPCIVAGMNLLMQIGLLYYSKPESIYGPLRIVVQWIPAVVSMLAYGLTIGYGLGYGFRIELIMGVFCGLVFIIVGNYLPKTRQNMVMGIRIPWTLESEENWQRTHRLAGFLWVVSGIAFIVISFIGWNLLTFIVLLAVMVLIPMGYSFSLHRRGI